jgi:hypothetical protein
MLHEKPADEIVLIAETSSGNIVRQQQKLPCHLCSASTKIKDHSVSASRRLGNGNSRTTETVAGQRQAALD